MQNEMALLLNNAGPYSGTWTRIPYLMSSGMCIICHAKILNSVPELVHEENILIGETPEEIASLFTLAVNDKSLRSRIGSKARITYEEKFSSKIVANKIATQLLNTFANIKS